MPPALGCPGTGAAAAAAGVRLRPARWAAVGARACLLAAEPRAALAAGVCARPNGDGCTLEAEAAGMRETPRLALELPKGDAVARDGGAADELAGADCRGSLSWHSMGSCPRGTARTSGDSGGLIISNMHGV